MTPFGVYHYEMPNDPLVLDDAKIEAFLSGRTLRADELGSLASFAEDLRLALNAPVPTPRPDLARLLSTGLPIAHGAVAAAASNFTPATQAGGLAKWRKAKMFGVNVIAGTVAKAALGFSVAAASVLGAGAAGVLPASVQHAVSTVVRDLTPIQLPDPTTLHASHPKMGPKGDGAGNLSSTTPGANTGAAVTGLNRANQTPAAGNVPTRVPTASTGGSTASTDRVNQTPAAGNVPTSLPTAATSGSGTSTTRVNQTPPAGHAPASMPPASTSGSTTSGAAATGSAPTGSAPTGSAAGINQIVQTPAVGHLPVIMVRP